MVSSPTPCRSASLSCRPVRPHVYTVHFWFTRLSTPVMTGHFCSQRSRHLHAHPRTGVPVALIALLPEINTALTVLASRIDTALPCAKSARVLAALCCVQSRLPAATLTSGFNGKLQLSGPGTRKALGHADPWSSRCRDGGRRARRSEEGGGQPSPACCLGTKALMPEIHRARKTLQRKKKIIHESTRRRLLER